MKLPIAEFGDVNFIEYGGQLLYEDDDGEFSLEVIEPPPDDADEDHQVWEIYRVVVERFKLVERDRVVYLVSEGYSEDWPHALSVYDEWFHRHLESVANCVGRDHLELRADICSEDPKKRASAYIDLASYFGWHEFDQYHLELSEHEVRERYDQLDGCECSSCIEKELEEEEE